MATKFNIDIIRGSRYLKGFTYVDSSKTPIDITGLDARMHIRRRDSSPAFDLELTTGNGRITTVPASGEINIVLTALETDTLTINSGVYDLELYDAGDLDIVDTILEGAVTIREAVTRE